MIVYTLQPTEEELKIFFDKFDKEKKGYIEATQVRATLMVFLRECLALEFL